ncbi:MAG: GNAT family N-acetyltransferase [Candidatus Sulfotelmatobacter sp.]
MSLGALPDLEYRRGEYLISTDPARLDLDVIHGFLTNCYWAKGIPREVVARSIQHSLCFGVYDDSIGSPRPAKEARPFGKLRAGHGAPQVGFARVVSDFATVAYLGDVFILESHRGRGLSKWLMECIMQHPALQGLRRWILLTRDAHGLYAQFGFTPVKAPERYMELHRPEIYEMSSYEIRKTT